MPDTLKDNDIKRARKRLEHIECDIEQLLVGFSQEFDIGITRIELTLLDVTRYGDERQQYRPQIKLRAVL